MSDELNIYEIVRKATASLEDNMQAAGRVPGPGQEPKFEYDEETNSFRLTILTIPRGECTHPKGIVPIGVLGEGGKITQVMYCPICKAVVS